MALSQALSTGITGLMTHQKAMDNIGNNLANVNTFGFKKGVYQFSTLLEQSLRGGMTADGTTGRGSVNPISMGLGAQTGSINKVFTQGPLEVTGNRNDMAINGNGFFVLKQGNGYAYTRAGDFYIGEDGSLMATNGGLYVQGTMAVKGANGLMSIPQDARLQNIVIPLGSTGGHVQTSQVQFTGNLNATQDLSTGTRLFGSSSYPTVANLQSWMWTDEFNGGDSATNNTVDETWNSLQQESFAISKSTWDAYSQYLGGTSIPSDVNIYSNGAVDDLTEDSYVYWALQVTPRYDSGGNLIGTNTEMVQLANPASVDPSQRYPMSVADINAANEANVDGPWMIPMIQQVNVINGGNVQTSTAYGIKVPEKLGFDENKVDPDNPPNAVSYSYSAPDGKTYAITNPYTYPMWFYESTGAIGSFETVVQLSNQLYDTAVPATVPPTAPPTAAEVDSIIRSIWPDGINGGGWPSGELTLANLPQTKEEYPASLTTPLEQLHYRKGNVWVQAFPNIKNGDEVTLSFSKGSSMIEATFKYNRPTGAEPALGQQSIDREQSYTLEHLLIFMAGDVDNPSAACQNITPAMFGAPVDEENPYGNVNAAGWDRSGYEQALRNVGMATSDSNLDSVGGAMGLLSIPPHISDGNYGSDAYDTPVESAGAYSRTGVQNVYYTRIGPDGKEVQELAPSFNISIVSNLGSQNAINDISFSYKGVSHETMFSAETEYGEAQGGSSVITVDVYDSLGNPKTVTLRLAMVSQTDDFTTWRWYADSLDDSDFQWQADPGTGQLNTNLNVGTGLIRFDKNGNYVKGAEYSETQGIIINQKNQGVNEPLWIKVLNGLSSNSTQDLDFSDLTCTAATSASNALQFAGQNGRPPGTLDDFTITLDGVIQGVYSNGYVVELARIGLATFANENGLVAAGSNLFYAGPASGEARYGHANSGGSGTVNHKQLESSNVDLSEEFTKLISIERGFQANSRTITTADEMITELLNLKR